MILKPVHRKTNRAFTKVELVVVVVIILVMLSMLIPALRPAKAVKSKISCVNNLKQIGLVFRLFAEDPANPSPMQVSTNQGGSLEYVGTGETWRHFLTLSNELGVPKILICPADDSSRVEASNFISDFSGNKNISYFIGLDADVTKPGSILSGDRHIEIDGKQQVGVVNLETNQNVGWITSRSHGISGNVLLGDGSVQQFNDQAFRNALLKTGDSTNRVSIPD
jgi:hypothetical protein